MIIYREVKNKPTADMLLDYDYMIHKAMAKVLGLRPLPRDQWQKTIFQRRKKTYQLIKALSESL